MKGLERIIESCQKSAETIRTKYAENIFSEQEKYRDDFKRMLGWPLVNHRADKLPGVEMHLLAEEEGYEIYRMQFEILDGLKMTGLFFKQNGEEKKPLVLALHGGRGTPELISGVYGGTSNYNDMLQRVRKKDVHVFAPQLLLWSEVYDVEYDRKERKCGKSHYTLRKMISLAINAITGFSVRPLRIISVLGFFVSMLSFAGIIWILVQYFNWLKYFYILILIWIVLVAKF